MCRELPEHQPPLQLRVCASCHPSLAFGSAASSLGPSGSPPLPSGPPGTASGGVAGAAGSPRLLRHTRRWKEGVMAPRVRVRVSVLLAQQVIAGKSSRMGFNWLHKTLDVKKLSGAKTCASVLALMLSSVKAVTDLPSPGCNPTSCPPAARSRGVSHELSDKNHVLAKSIAIPVFFHAHTTSEL